MKRNCIIVAYDIENDKLRRHLSKFLEQHGVRLQFSVFEIAHSNRVLDLVCEKIQRDFKKRFKESDSVIIFSTNLDEAITYGNASHLNKDLVIISE